MRDAILPERILVGVDELGLADEAVRAALFLESALKAELELLHVVPRPPEAWPGLDPLASVERNVQLVAMARDSTASRLAELARTPEGGARLLERLRVLPGRPGEVLVREAARQPGTLIALGAKRHRGLVHLGGTMRAALTHSRCPLWVQNAPFRGVRRILAPIDLSSPSLRSLSAACALAQRLGASVSALHVFDQLPLVGSSWRASQSAFGAPPDDLVHEATRARFDDALERFAWRGVAHERLFEVGPPVERILCRARAHDLVVVGSHGWSGAATAVLGSTAWSVLLSSEGSVLVVREPGVEVASEDAT